MGHYSAEAMGLSSWNYRIVRYLDRPGFGLHEIFYNSHGEACGMTLDPVNFSGDTPQDIRDDLVLALSDVKKRPILDEPAQWAAWDEGSEKSRTSHKED